MRAQGGHGRGARAHAGAGAAARLDEALARGVRLAARLRLLRREVQVHALPAGARRGARRGQRRAGGGAQPGGGCCCGGAHGVRRGAHVLRHHLAHRRSLLQHVRRQGGGADGAARSAPARRRQQPAGGGGQPPAQSLGGGRAGRRACAAGASAAGAARRVSSARLRQRCARLARGGSAGRGTRLQASAAQPPHKGWRHSPAPPRRRPCARSLRNERAPCSARPSAPTLPARHGRLPLHAAPAATAAPRCAGAGSRRGRGALRRAANNETRARLPLAGSGRDAPAHPEPQNSRLRRSAAAAPCTPTRASSSCWRSA